MTKPRMPGKRNKVVQPEAILLRSLERAPIAYAATRGPEHALFFANPPFRKLAGLPADDPLGHSFAETFRPPAASRWLAVLDQAARGSATSNAEVPSLNQGQPGDKWCCTVWGNGSVGNAEYCLIEVHEQPLPDHTLLDVAEQLLLSALREAEAAVAAEAARKQAVLLADATQRLTESLDVERTLASIASIAALALPSTQSWCIVDVVKTDGSMRRVAIVHPDADQQAKATGLIAAWQPDANDFFGLPEAIRSRRSQVTNVNREMLESVADSAEHKRLLKSLGFASLLSVPLIVRNSVIGAVTFVKGPREKAFTEEDINLAETVSSRSALALDNALLYSEAQILRAEAESANRAKSEFLKHMSHELRTPLNAILGYVELMAMGLHGPVTDAQHSDLDRIRQSNHHLLMLITDILDYTRLSSGTTRFEVVEIDVAKVIVEVVNVLQSLADERQTTLDVSSVADGVMACADGQRVQQIVVNLVANAIKYSPPGSRVRIDCLIASTTVQVRVMDNGPGIPPDHIEAIFEPFKQVSPVYTRTEGGVGLGLAISRDLAAGMNGTLTVQSTVGEGSCFTLTLPRA